MWVRPAQGLVLEPVPRAVCPEQGCSTLCPTHTAAKGTDSEAEEGHHNSAMASGHS